MKIIEPSHQILAFSDCQLIEQAGRTCYKSEKESDRWTARKFIKMLIERGHESVIEHCYATVKFICDRGVSHELVRHRLASYSQESTRYCNYSQERFGSEITFIKPPFFAVGSTVYICWKQAMANAERDYLMLIKNGAAPQEARSVLPNSLKTEVVMTANFREWRHVFRLRTSVKAHPQMRQVMIPVQQVFALRLPEVFRFLGEEIDHE